MSIKIIKHKDADAEDLMSAGIVYRISNPKNRFGNRTDDFYIMLNTLEDLNDLPEYLKKLQLVEKLSK